MILERYFVMVMLQFLLLAAFVSGFFCLNDIKINKSVSYILKKYQPFLFLKIPSVWFTLWILFTWILVHVPNISIYINDFITFQLCYNIYMLYFNCFQVYFMLTI